MADPNASNGLPLDLIDDDRYWEGFVLPPSAFADLCLPNLGSTGDPIMLTAEGEVISDAMVAGYEYLFANGAAVRAAVLDAMLDYYVATRQRWAGQLDADELEALMPPITGPQDLTARMELSGIKLHDVELDGCGYVGLGFHCAWDEEHGAGVMTHRTRVVSCGGADTPILKWIADRDLAARTGGVATASKKGAPKKAAPKKTAAKKATSKKAAPKKAAPTKTAAKKAASKKAAPKKARGKKAAAKKQRA